MSLTLTANIAATDTVIQVTGTVGAEVVRGYTFVIDDEVFRFGKFERDTGPLTSNPTSDDTDRWSVTRGVFGSVPASHTSTTALVPFPAAAWAALAGAASPSGANPFTTGLRTATATVTSPEILALNTTKVSLVPGVVRKGFWPIAVLATMRPGATPYTPAGDYLRIGFTDDALSVAALATISDALLGASAIALSTATIEGASNLPGAGWSGSDLVIEAGGSNPTLGDGELDLTILCKLLDAPGTYLVFGVQPSAVVANAVISPAFTVRALDADGNLILTDALDVTVALTTPGGALIGGTATKTSVQGVSTFDDITVDTAGTYTFTATATAYSHAVSGSFVVSAA